MAASVADLSPMQLSHGKFLGWLVFGSGNLAAGGCDALCAVSGVVGEDSGPISPYRKQ